jgi:hypothetical protein
MVPVGTGSGTGQYAAGKGSGLVGAGAGTAKQAEIEGPNTDKVDTEGSLDKDPWGS